jgi:hypothetical protein
MKKLPKVLMEAPNELVELPREELEEMLGSYSPDDVADKDYVDADTGEIVWEKGERLRDTHIWREQNLAVDLTAEEKESLKDAYVAWSGGNEPGDDPGDGRDEEQFLGSEEFAALGLDVRAGRSALSSLALDFYAQQSRDESEEEDQKNASAQDELLALVDEYASQYQGTAAELGAKPEDAAPDLAQSFFLLHPEWRDLARRAGLGKESVRGMVQDAIYEAMTGGDVQEAVQLSVSQLRRIIREAVAPTRTARGLPTFEQIDDLAERFGGIESIRRYMRALKAAGAPITIDTLHYVIMAGIGRAADAASPSFSYTGGQQVYGVEPDA